MQEELILTSISRETEEGRRGKEGKGRGWEEGRGGRGEFTGNMLGYFMDEESLKQLKTKKGYEPA